MQLKRPLPPPLSSRRGECNTCPLPTSPFQGRSQRMQYVCGVPPLSETRRGAGGEGVFVFPLPSEGVGGGLGLSGV